MTEGEACVVASKHILGDEAPMLVALTDKVKLWIQRDELP